MKPHEAMFKAISEVKLVLKSAGVLEGITLTPEAIKTTKDILFWFIAVKTEDASRKSTYVIFNVVEVNPFTYGDGKALSYKAQAQIALFTNKEDISSLIAAINNAAEEYGWDFDMLRPITYDQTSKLYNYLFALEVLV